MRTVTEIFTVTEIKNILDDNYQINRYINYIDDDTLLDAAKNNKPLKTIKKIINDYYEKFKNFINEEYKDYNINLDVEVQPIVILALLEENGNIQNSLNRRFKKFLKGIMESKENIILYKLSNININVLDDNFESDLNNLFIDYIDDIDDDNEITELKLCINSIIYIRKKKLKMNL